MNNSETNYDDLKNAVMQAMRPLPSLNPCGVTEKDQPKLDRLRAKTQQWREWAESEPSLDADTRRAYLEWCSHCDWTNDRAQKEITYGERRKSYEAYVARTEAKSARVAQIEVVKPKVKF